MPDPTPQDIENAKNRQEIAERQNAEYREVERLTLTTLGPGFKPWMKLVLLPSDYHQTGDNTPAAVAFKVYCGEKKLTENSVVLRKMPDGTVMKATNYQELFPELHELHPTRTLEVKGKLVPAPQWSLCWSALELYEPKSAEDLAALRVSRERGREKREDARFAAENPLLAQAGIRRKDLQEPEGRER
jgi:hypothetical protein